VTAIELGIPFSDPVADGPTIQAAIQEAIRHGVTVRKSLDFVATMRREGLVLPVLGMTYANLVYAPGLDRAAQAWAAAGLDGAIVPDVPHEESDPLRTAFHREGLGTVSFASPGTGDERLERIVRGLDSFVYLVAVYGTTGARADIAPETRILLRRARAARRGQRPPLLVGFGVSRPSHVKALRGLGADGVIVGSALVAPVRRGEDLRPYLRSLVRAANGSA